MLWGSILTLKLLFSLTLKLLWHLYNTTQKILVNGHAYEKLVKFFLKPYFDSKLPNFDTEIDDYNNLVLETLGSRKVKRSDVKYNGGSTFPCKM